LSPDQRKTLQVIYDLRNQHQLQWPSLDYVERKLHRDYQIDLRQLLHTIPERYILHSVHSTGDAVLRLNVAGIACCDGSDGDIRLFLRALRWCYGHERAFLPTSTTTVEEVRVSSSEFATAWAAAGEEVSTVIMIKVFSFLTIENIVYGSQTPGKPEEWTMAITREVRKFGNVASLPEYLAIKEQPREVPSQIISSGPRLTRRRYTDPGGYPIVASAINDSLGIPTFATSSKTEGEELLLSIDDLHPIVSDACRDLFDLGRFREGTIAAVIAFRDQVRTCTGLNHDDGLDLIGKAFGGQQPRLEVADQRLDPETIRNIRQGMLYLSQGLWFLVRNPLIHHSTEIEPTEAMRIAGLVDMLVRRVEGRGFSPSSSAEEATTNAGRSD
jgi:uncharacterized protein (TIGR02391 family)